MLAALTNSPKTSVDQYNKCLFLMHTISDVGLLQLVDLFTGYLYHLEHLILASKVIEEGVDKVLEVMYIPSAHFPLVRPVT